MLPDYALIATERQCYI